MPGGTDTTGQAAARYHGTQEPRNAAHWDSGAYTGVREVSRGEGCEPVLQHLVVHDDVCPWGGRGPDDELTLGCAPEASAGCFWLCSARSGGGPRANAAELVCR